jgi:biopolymer transport protein ExbD
MKFPRNARIFRGQLDAAPFATVFFLLLIFVVLGSLVYTPGVRILPPAADNLPGTDQPTVTVAVDAGNRLYFANQIINEADLKARLHEAHEAAVKNAAQPLTLLIRADKAVSCENLVHLTLLARGAGITNALLATLPRAIDTPPERAKTKP